jgi:DNA replication and repair protein RecF
VDADVDLPDAGCVIVGRNGHGKTSLIEALLYTETFRSFRRASDAELVRFGADGFHVEAGRVAVGYDARTKEKKIVVNGVLPERMADAIGMVKGVVLSPADVALVAGGPRERRRFLDVLLSITAPGYVDALTRYRRAVAHRGRATPAEIEAWERVIAECGAAIVAARCRWAERWSDVWAELCAAMGETAVPRLEYRARTAGDADAIGTALAASRDRDRAVGRCTVGPHRDELRLTIDGRPLRSFGSAGQQRTGALALRLLEASCLEASGDGALLCLDDAFAELDATRSRRLGELIEKRAAAGSQIVAAVPKETDVPDVIGGLARWTISDGRISA